MFKACSLQFSKSRPSSLQAPSKVVPVSERRRFDGPQIEKNLLNALIKLSVVTISISSICTALVDMHMNNKSQHWLWHLPSRPTVVKGGDCEIFLDVGKVE